MDEVQGSREPSPLFKNEDILGIIFSHFDTKVFGASHWIPDTETRKNLRSAALTSRAFFTPAISLLWRMLDSIMPLLKLIPSFVIVSDIHTMNGIITPQDLEIVAFYSKHIKYMRLEDLSNPICGHVVHRLSSLRNPLLPNLQCIYIPSLDYIVMDANLDIVFLALSQSLKTFHIKNIHADSENHVVSYLSVLDQKQADLEDISLGGQLCDQILCLLPRFVHLKKLKIFLNYQNLSSTILRAWSSLPALAFLAVDADTTSTLEPISTQDSALIDFPALKDIRLGGTPPEVLNILRSIKNSNKTVTTITLIMSCLWSVDESIYSVVLVDCITECVRIAKHLEVFRLQMPKVGPAQSVTLPADALLHFSACLQLRRFEISAVNLCADDDTILSMCASGAWRNLHTLHLPHGVDDESPSLYSLKVIAAYCPNLEVLKICVDLRLWEYESLQSELNGPRKKHGLKSLTLVKLLSDNTTRRVAGVDAQKMSIAVSRYIDNHFSYLESLNFVTHSTSDQDWWKGILAEFQSTRAQATSED